MFNTPVLFVVFNRPDVTARVFEAIRRIRPAKLYISADGPRAHKEGEVNLCRETRRVTENIDWPCEVSRKYSDTNLGCKKGVSSAITWFFDNVEEGIILEDDCLPDPSFFSFCEELLNKYRNTERVKIISGDNFQFGKKYGEASYYFSNFPHIWGWATWKRVWQEYDIEMKGYPEFKKKDRIAKIFKDRKIRRFWISLFDKLYNNKIDTWDGQLVYSIYSNDGIVVLPNINLISNIGFNNYATHTKEVDNILSNIKTDSIGTVIHPEIIVVEKEADEIFFKKVFYRSLFRRIVDKIKSIK